MAEKSDVVGETVSLGPTQTAAAKASNGTPGGGSGITRPEAHQRGLADGVKARLMGEFARVARGVRQVWGVAVEIVRVTNEYQRDPQVGAASVTPELGSALPTATLTRRKFDVAEDSKIGNSVVAPETSKAASSVDETEVQDSPKSESLSDPTKSTTEDPQVSADGHPSGLAATLPPPTLTRPNAGTTASEKRPMPQTAAISQAATRRRPEWTWSPPSPTLPAPRAGLWGSNVDCVSSVRTLDQGVLIGAAVRGRGHKLDALYCDDSFDYLDVGQWRVVMVSDGAGSAAFSRVGSQIACDAVRQVLERELPGADLSSHTIAQNDLNDIRTSPERDRVLGHAAKALEQAFDRAYSDICDWVSEQNAPHNDESAIRRWVDKQFRGTDKEAARLVRGNPQAPLRVLEKDCNCTLLVAAYGVVGLQKNDGPATEIALSLSCAVGDGMMVVLRSHSEKSHCVIPLMSPDAGEFAGQTQFVDARTTAAESVAARTRLNFLGNPADVVAIAAMTDGVADDYYEGKAGMERLYCDLLLNGILPTSGGPDVASLIEGPESIMAAVRHEPVFEDRAAGTESRTRCVKYSKHYLGYKKMESAELLGKPDLLHILAHAEPHTAANPNCFSAHEAAERLRDWLDTYVVSGSFDDRSLSMFITR